MQKLLFSGLLGSPALEATLKFYLLHPNKRTSSLTIFPFRKFKNSTNKVLGEFNTLFEKKNAVMEPLL